LSDSAKNGLSKDMNVRPNLLGGLTSELIESSCSGVTTTQKNDFSFLQKLQCCEIIQIKNVLGKKFLGGLSLL